MVNPSEGDFISGPGSIKSRNIKPELVDTEKIFSDSLANDIVIYQDNKSGEIVAIDTETELARGSDFGRVFNTVLGGVDDEIWQRLQIGPINGHQYSTKAVLDRSKVVVEGVSKHASRPDYTGNDAALMIDGAHEFAIRHLGFNADGSSESQDIIHLYSGNNGIRNSLIEDMWLNGAGRHNIHEETANGNNMWGMIYRDIDMGGCGSHAYISNTGGGSGGTAEKRLESIHAMYQSIGGDFIVDTKAGLNRQYINCRAEPSVEGTGFRLAGQGWMSVRDCKAEGCGDHGFDLTGFSGVLRRAVAYGNANNGFHLPGDYGGSRFDMLQASHNGNTGIYVGSNGETSDAVLGKYRADSTENLRYFTKVEDHRRRGKATQNARSGAVSSNQTVTHPTDFVAVETRSSEITLTLESPPGPGGPLYIKDADGNASNNPITIQPDADGYSIDDDPSHAIESDYGSVALYWDDESWWII